MRHCRGRQCLCLDEFAPGASWGTEPPAVDELCGDDRCLADGPSGSFSLRMSSGHVHPGSRSNPDVEDMMNVMLLNVNGFDWVNAAPAGVHDKVGVEG